MSDLRILAFEDALAADDGGTERDRLLRHLAGLAADARASLDKGVPPDDAQRLISLIAAFEAGQAVVVRVWAYLHSRGS